MGRRGPWDSRVPRMLWFVLAIGGVFIGSESSQAQATDTVVVPGTTLCSECRVRLELLTTLGSDDGPGALASSPIAIQKDSEGRYYVLGYQHTSGIKVFDSSGEYLYEIGKEGEGPGELKWARSLMVSPEDSVLVFDPSVGRMSVFSTDGTFLRSSRVVGLIEDAVELVNGVLAVNGRHVPERSDRVLHFLSREGDLLASAEGSPAGSAMPGPSMRSLAASPEGTVWTAERNAYVLREWLPSGNELQVLRRDAPWFQPHTEIQLTEEGVSPWVRDVSVSPEGKLRVLIGVAGSRWSEMLPEPTLVNGQEVYPVETGAGHYATRIEVLDPMTGRMEVSSRIEVELLKFVTPDLIASYALEGPGYPRIQIWRIKIDQ